MIPIASRHPASYYVLALVSGLPSRKRYSRLALMLQAYFDDSTERGNALIFAGYLASVDTWLRFSDDWDELLTMRCPKRPFKMSETCPTSERAMFHYRAIERAGLVAIGCAIPIVPLAKVVTELGLNSALNDPYYLAWRAVITLSLLGSKMLGSRDPIEFIFDDQTEKINIIKAWDYFYGGAPRGVRKRIRGIPSFKRDEDVVALQAADMLAWWARKQYVVDPDNMETLFPHDWTNGKNPPILFADMPEENIRVQLRKDAEIARRRASEIRLRARFRLSRP